MNIYVFNGVNELPSATVSNLENGVEPLKN